MNMNLIKLKIKLMRYEISNKSNKKVYVKNFNCDEDCKNWIINHLDLSILWEYKKDKSK